MVLVEFQEKDGKAVWVNPTQVVCVRDAGLSRDVAQIVLISSEVITVDRSVASTASKLNDVEPTLRDFIDAVKHAS